MTFRDEEFKKWEEVNQFNLPKRLAVLLNAMGYGDKLSYNQVVKLYRISVEEVLTIHNVKCLCELPFGSGYIVARCKWLKKMKEAVEIVETKNIIKGEKV